MTSCLSKEQKNSEATAVPFEKAFARLEEILEKMNSGKLSLEESLKLYEEADNLIVCCANRLNEAEEKIEMLIKKRDGQLSLNSESQPQTESLGL
ncbi:MAG: exodeoxyribonuclease VII small subunit [Verrucomicrobia bacterium]|nr:exodeoxyribonuclease VII small subunit [Verrucomicrobiota bacterium]MBS0646085.1 exodeoxyribonuclease VII small subunit [Verrucomicrobiota bacterium]